MSDQIIGLRDWFATPSGRYLLAWEKSQMDRAVADIFGFHALQLGLPELTGLALNRMPHRWLANDAPTAGVDFITDYSSLPFSANSLDLLLLPHSLELACDPHAALREVERVLVAEGRVVICGFNRTSLWALRQYRSRLFQRLGWGQSFLPTAGEFIGYRRLRDWLRLLGLEVEAAHFGCYRPALTNEVLLQRLRWMDALGARWWSILGALYFIVAVKRVRGMTLLSPAWKPARVAVAAPVSVANSNTLTQAEP